jgi:hypothetical protein
MKSEKPRSRPNVWNNQKASMVRKYFSLQRQHLGGSCPGEHLADGPRLRTLGTLVSSEFLLKMDIGELQNRSWMMFETQ